MLHIIVNVVLLLAIICYNFHNTYVKKDLTCTFIKRVKKNRHEWVYRRVHLHDNMLDSLDHCFWSVSLMESSLL